MGDARDSGSRNEAPAFVDERGQISRDLMCRRCGYNLRGLSESAMCPECSTPVHRSIHGDLLRYSDPRWLRTLAGGAYCVIIGAIPLIAGAVLLGLRRTPRPWVVVMMVAAGSVVALGLWKLTARDPGVPEEARQAAARRVIRLCIVAMFVMQAGMTQIATMPGWLRYGYVLVTIAVGVTCIVAFFRHLRELARRMPDVALERDTRVVMWGLAASYGISTGLALAAIAPGSLPRPLHMVFAFWCAFIVAAQIFTVWSLTLMVKFSARLSAAAAESLRQAEDVKIQATAQSPSMGEPRT
jgi:hypothetical protein